MSAMGGGERLCCETMRALINRGDRLTLLSGEFMADRLERFFGYEGLFRGISVKTYPADPGDRFGTYKHLIRIMTWSSPLRMPATFPTFQRLSFSGDTSQTLSREESMDGLCEYTIPGKSGG